jgi:hypothetical protein
VLTKKELNTIGKQGELNFHRIQLRAGPSAAQPRHLFLPDGSDEIFTKFSKKRKEFGEKNERHPFHYIVVGLVGLGAMTYDRTSWRNTYYTYVGRY